MAQSQGGNFYLGRLFDPVQGKTLDQPLMYDPADLTTHGVIIGMTGSGKTGLGVDFLEEAALQNIPAIIVDPKGDLTNLMLHFPDLLPKDFAPWIDPDAARRAGKDIDTMAAETATFWKNGLQSWGLGHDQLLSLQLSAHFTVFTPGSTSGQPVNILSSFQAPGIAWADNSEILREKITTIVTALLGLVGIKDIDPLRSREHILISNLIENAWSKGQSLDLTELIMQTQNPPIERLGAFPVDSFFPAKDRAELAMLLNNFLASPSFQTWLAGQPLDVGSLLYGKDNKPCHSIFYLAHLNDDERMFFVTLLFAAIEAWMRTQRGTSGLRALVYFDEIYGYLPPVANPPSRPVLLRMLKQARAFGLGLLLATQNPVDIDYKALSNAGTWVIGRLQTDQDKQRLLDGLESSAGGVDRSYFDKMISGLGKRVFLMQNVHQSKPQLFQTRWTLNYLAGPLTRTQIPALNSLAGVTAPAAVAPPVATPANVGGAAPRTAATTEVGAAYSGTRPALPPGVEEYFIPAELSFNDAARAANLAAGAQIESQGIVYHPALLGQVEVRYGDRRYNLDYTNPGSVLVQDFEGALMHWENYPWRVYKTTALQSQPVSQARFVSLPGWLSDAKKIASLQKDYLDWVFRNSTIRIRANTALKVYAGPQVSQGDFREQCSQAARQGLQKEQDQLDASYKQKMTSLQQKIDQQELQVKKKEQEVSSRRIEEVGAGGQFLMGLLGGRRRSLNSSLTKHRLAQQASTDLEQERKELEAIQAQLAGIEKDKAAAAQQLQERWEQVVNTVTEIPLEPAKQDIYQELFGVAWLPYYLIKVGGDTKEIPAYQSPAG
jgi:hypothetical protein